MSITAVPAVTLHVGLAQMPSDDADTAVLEARSVTVRGEDYQSAITAAEERVPEGWRIVSLRVERARSASPVG